MLMLLRYGLIVCPALCTAYLLPLDRMESFTAGVLLLLAWAECRRLLMPAGWQPASAALEMAGIAWMCGQYEGLMFACHCSTMTTYITRELRSTRWWLLLVQLFVLNAGLNESRELELRLTANLLFAAGALLLHLLDESRRHKSQLERVYDELRLKAYELEAARQRLIEYAGRVEALAQAEERSRIAHDLHDELGHKLIRHKMMLDAALHIGESSPQTALSLAGQVRDQISGSMESLRQTVRRLKPPEEEVRAYSLSRLIAELSDGLPLAVHHQVHGMPRPLYPSLEIVLYRNAQEAITNAIRHGGAGAVWIELSYEPDRVTLSIANNGRLSPPDGLRRGLGLAGMEERTRLVGGELSIECRERFTVITTVPVPA